MVQLFHRALAEWRIQKIEENLKKSIITDIDGYFQFDPRGTDLFSTVELVNSYSRRILDLTQCTNALLSMDRLLPSVVLARALLETVAMGCYFLETLETCIKNRDNEGFKNAVTKFFAGSRRAEIKPPHVADAIRHLKLIDNNYFEYLKSKHTIVEDFRRSLKVDGKEISEEEFSAWFKEHNSLTSAYAWLSEVSHPNGMGTHNMYPAYISDVDHKVQCISRQLVVRCQWSANFWLTKLDGLDALIRSYRETFTFKASG